MPSHNSTSFGRDGKGVAVRPSPLPCLSSNNSIQGVELIPSESLLKQGSTLLSTQQKKSATALSWNVQGLAEKYGIERLGFLTLTFADNVQDYKEAQRRFNSLASNALRHLYVDYIRVWERTKRGRIHYHLLVVCKDDIRTGFDFAGIAQQDYSSANAAIRHQWAWWRKNAKQYGFGRTELLPIKSTAEGIARYVGKYISKNVQQREERDKGSRLVEYSRGARTASTRFNFVSEGSQQWRQKMAVFAAIVGHGVGLGRPAAFHELSTILGSSWAYFHREFIIGLPTDLADLPDTVHLDNDVEEFDPLAGLDFSQDKLEAFHEWNAIRLADSPPDEYPADDGWFYVTDSPHDSSLPCPF